MSRPIAVKKAVPLLGLAATALRGVGTKVAAKVAEKGVGGALKEGAKAAVAQMPFDQGQADRQEPREGQVRRDEHCGQTAPDGAHVAAARRPRQQR